MRGLDLQVDKKNLQQLLNQYPNLVVPLFQRPYSWEPEQWSQLWDDLMGSLDQDYLIGGIVLCGSDDGTEQIIDGQQRLSTLTILAAACRDVAFEIDGFVSETVSYFHNQLVAQKRLGSKESKPFLTLGLSDKDWFRSRIQSSPDHPNFDPPKKIVPYKISSSNRLLWRCYRYFYDNVKGAVADANESARNEFFSNLHRMLVSQLWFVVTRVPDDSTAYTLFEVLNDRGLDLTIADLLKNVVLSEGEKHKAFEHARHEWGQIAERIDYPLISQYLRYLWMSQQGKKTTDKELFTRLKDDLRASKKDQFLKKLKNWADEASNYAEIAGVLGGQSQNQSLSEELELLRSYGFRTVYTVLLSVWAVTNPDDHSVRRQAVRLFRVFLVRYAIFAGKVTNSLEGEMASLAFDIRKSAKVDIESLAQKLREMGPAEKQVWAGFETLEPKIAVARLLLSEIENQISGSEKALKGSNDVHVEHIYPQNPDPAWGESFSPPDEASTFRDRLGNLTLLSGKKNRSASNKPYAKKKAFYKGSSIRLTTELHEEWPSWSKDAVIERQARLADYARKVWKL